MSFPFTGFFAPRLAFRRACGMWGLFIGRCISICYMYKRVLYHGTQHTIHNTHAHRLPKRAASKNIWYGNENDGHTQHTESVSVESISGGNISLMLSRMRSSVVSDVCTLGFLRRNCLPVERDAFRLSPSMRLTNTSKRRRLPHCFRCYVAPHTLVATKQ